MDKHQRLMRARERAGFTTATDAARAMGVNPSTYLSHENSTRDFDESAAAKYARKFGVAVQWLVFGIEGEAPVAPAGQLPVVGEVRAGAWLEIDEVVEPSQFLPIGPDQRFARLEQFALRVVGTSMNKVVTPGQFVIVADWQGNGGELKDGELVVVRRERAMTYEVTLKRAKKTSKGWELWPESTDPRYQEPLTWDDGTSDIEVRVIGKVIGKYEPM